MCVFTCSGLTLAKSPLSCLFTHCLHQERGRNSGEKACGLRLRQGDCLLVTVVGKTNLTWGKLIEFIAN